MRDLADAAIEGVRRRLAAHPRQNGYYMAKLVSFSPGSVVDDRRLDSLFEYFDDKAWPLPYEERMRLSPSPWADLETSESAAAAEVVEALVGGCQAGHAADTMSPGQASELWRAFRSLFSDQARFFTGLGLGSSQYAIQRGVAVVDVDRAGVLCVVEGD